MHCECCRRQAHRLKHPTLSLLYHMFRPRGRRSIRHDGRHALTVVILKFNLRCNAVSRWRAIDISNRPRIIVERSTITYFGAPAVSKNFAWRTNRVERSRSRIHAAILAACQKFRVFTARRHRRNRYVCAVTRRGRVRGCRLREIFHHQIDL